MPKRRLKINFGKGDPGFAVFQEYDPDDIGAGAKLVRSNGTEWVPNSVVEYDIDISEPETQGRKRTIEGKK